MGSPNIHSICIHSSSSKKNSISDVNSYVLDFVDSMIENANSKVDLIDIIEHSYEFIEQNKVLLEYADKELYSHQKDIYSIFRQNKKKRPKANLVLYRTPTGTGKTMTPLGLSSDYRIIFVCAARHIGLALAKSAISMNKKIAFAFGCETASDIRLHYFAASDYTRDKRSGGIRKVSNEQGEKVEIIVAMSNPMLPRCIICWLSTVQSKSLHIGMNQL